jgi:hypothetical protein
MGAFQLWRFSLVISGTTKQNHIICSVGIIRLLNTHKACFFFLVSSQHTSCVTKFQLHCDWKNDIKCVTYFLQNSLPRWNQILTQLRFIHNQVITGIEWMVLWWVLGFHNGTSEEVGVGLVSYFYTYHIVISIFAFLKIWDEGNISIGKCRPIFDHLFHCLICFIQTLKDLVDRLFSLPFWKVSIFHFCDPRLCDL